MGNYVSTAGAAAFLGVDGTNEALLADLEVKILLAEEIVEDFCNTEFVYSPDSVSMILDGNGRTNLPLPKYLKTLTALELIDTDETVSDTYTLTDVYKIPANYNRDVFSSLELKDGSPFPRGAQNIKVTGTWGLQTIPNAIITAVYLTIQNLYNLIGRDAGVKSSSDIYRKVEYMPQTSYDKASVASNIVPIQAQMALHRYRFLNKWLASE